MEYLSDYRNNLLELQNVQNPEWIIFGIQKTTKRYWEFEILNRNNIWHSYPSKSPWKTKNSPDANPEWIIFGIQKNPSQNKKIKIIPIIKQNQKLKGKAILHMHLPKSLIFLQEASLSSNTESRFKFTISAYLAMICTFLVYLTHGWDTTWDTYIVFNWKQKIEQLVSNPPSHIFWSKNQKFFISGNIPISFHGITNYIGPSEIPR